MREYHWRAAGAVRFDGLRCGTMRKKLSLGADSLPDMLDAVCALPGVPDISLDNFRRGDATVKRYLLASMLALTDAGLPSGGDAAVLDFSREGSHRQNKAYFEDYKTFGRQLGRGHLFVGTLPSTPVCEAAIALRFHGAVFYLNARDRMHAFWKEIELLLTEYPAVLAFYRMKTVLYAFVMVPGATRFDPDEPGPDALFAGDFRE